LQIFEDGGVSDTYRSSIRQVSECPSVGKVSDTGMSPSGSIYATETITNQTHDRFEIIPHS